MGRPAVLALDEQDPAVAAPAQCNDDFHAAVLAASGSTRLPMLVAMVSSAPLVRHVLQSYGSYVGSTQIGDDQASSPSTWNARA